MRLPIAQLQVLVASSMWIASVGAAGQSYMSLVGELVGKVESLRMLRDHCAAAAPETAVKNAKAYEAWAERNAGLIAQVQTQRERADTRILKQAADNPSAPKSTTKIVAILQRGVFAQLASTDIESQRTMCAQYPDMISASEKSRSKEIAALLKTVTHADEVLTQREARQ